jgi:DNA-binding GntR family transcriptional regulator
MLRKAMLVIIPQTLSSQVFEKLLKMIVSGELVTGRPLQEMELVQMFGVSRTPIREALRRLLEYGVMEARPNHTAVVRRLGREELIHIQQVRQVLEEASATLACGKLSPDDFAHLEGLASSAQDEDSPDQVAAQDELDDELHCLIATRTGNPILAREIRKFTYMMLIVYRQLERELGTEDKDMVQAKIRKEALREHIRIIAALKAGDPAASGRAMIDHVRAASERMIALREETLRAALPKREAVK